MQSFEKIRSGIERAIPSLWNLTSGILLLVFLETPKNLIKSFIIQWKRSANIVQKSATVLAGLIVAVFILYGLHGLWSDICDWKNKEWREEVLLQSYEEEISSFFAKYNESFLAHDCGFMREVAADEAMYDKWGRTAYPDSNYSCEEFINFQEKYMIPIRISPIEQTGDKYRVKGEAIIIKLNQGEPWKVESMYFDLWKKLDWDLWHFNNPKEGPRKIPIEVDSY